MPDTPAESGGNMKLEMQTFRVTTEIIVEAVGQAQAVEVVENYLTPAALRSEGPEAYLLAKVESLGRTTVTPHDAGMQFRVRRTVAEGAETPGSAGEPGPGPDGPPAES